MNQTGAIPEWSLSDRLAKSLQFAEMSADDMAAVLQIHANTVRNYMFGRTNRIPRATLLVWADATGVDPNWLITGKP